MRLIGPGAFVVGAIIIASWLYVLTGRVQLLLSYAEQIIDRDHGPTLPPDVRPEPVRNEPPQPVAVHVADQPTDPGQVPTTVPMNVPEPQTDEVPVVRPIPPKTQPSAAVLIGHWAQGVDDFEARQERMLDEARAAIQRIAEGAA